jgi:hypothetical protein
VVLVSPLNGWVLIAGAALTSPVLWSAFVEGTTSMQTALLRLVVAISLLACGIKVVSWLLDETSAGDGDLPDLRAAPRPGSGSTTPPEPQAPISTPSGS